MQHSGPLPASLELGHYPITMIWKSVSTDHPTEHYACTQVMVTVEVNREVYQYNPFYLRFHTIDAHINHAVRKWATENGVTRGYGYRLLKYCCDVVGQNKCL